MIYITLNDYHQAKKDFFDKHGDPTSIVEGKSLGDVTYKSVGFEDGSLWFETTERVVEYVTGYAHSIAVRLPADFIKTEIFNSDKSTSAVLYEQAEGGTFHE